MGFSISWLAVKGKPPEVVTQELGLRPTGEVTDYGDSLFTGHTLSSGWFLLVIDQSDHDYIKPKSLASLSSDCEVVACSIEEHVIVSTAELWRNGARVWHIEHSAQQSVDHISTSGSLPDGYSAIERECADQQQATGNQTHTDYYSDIPLLTAKSIVGFKHDEAGPNVDFEVYEDATPSAHTSRRSDRDNRPWWKLW